MRVPVEFGLAVILALLLLTRCDRGTAQPNNAVEKQTEVQATLLTIRQTVSPRNEVSRYFVVLGNGMLRIGNEKDQWRLFDLNKREVVFVDDITRTWRPVLVDRLIEDRLYTLKTPPPMRLGKARYHDTRVVQRLAGFDAHQHVIELGPYRREIWLSTRDLVPLGFFPMLMATDPLDGEWAAVMSEAWPKLVQLHGFPVRDVSTMPWKGETIRVERQLEKLERRRVPATWLRVPAGYSLKATEANP